MIDDLKKMYFQIGPSKINKIGLIAFRPIPKNTNVFEAIHYGIKFYSYKTLRKKGIPTSVVKVIKKYCAFTKSGIEIPDNFFSNTHLRIVNYINHSDDPNLRVISSRNKVSYISRKPIKKNEELTINYNENNYCPKCIDFKPTLKS